MTLDPNAATGGPYLGHTTADQRRAVLGEPVRPALPVTPFLVEHYRMAVQAMHAEESRPIGRRDPRPAIRAYAMAEVFSTMLGNSRRPVDGDDPDAVLLALRALLDDAERPAPVCANCGQAIESDEENGWVHVEDGVVGCGKPFADAERYAEPALPAVDPAEAAAAALRLLGIEPTPESIARILALRPPARRMPAAEAAAAIINPPAWLAEALSTEPRSDV